MFPINKKDSFGDKVQERLVAAALAFVRSVIKLGKFLFIFGIPIAIILLILIAVKYFAVFEFKGTDMEYDYRAPNPMEYKEDASDPLLSKYEVKEINEDNEIMRDFYKYYSKKSYWQVNVKDENGKLINADHDDAVVDYWKREKDFLLHPNMLFNLDEIMFEGEWRYPEQFIQPLAHDREEFELKQILDDSGNIQVESDKRDEETGERLEQKEKSVADYGFGTIIKYKEMDNRVLLKGNYIAQDVFNEATGEVEKKQIEEPFEFELPNPDPEPKYIFDKLICIEGNVKFNYEQGFELVENVADGISTNEKENVDKIQIGTAVKKTYNKKLSEERGKPVYDEEKIPLYKYRDGNSGIFNAVEIPTTPDKDIQDLKYYYDYLERFKAYIPYSVNLDLRRRIDYNELKKIKEIEIEENQADSLTSIIEGGTVDVSGIEIGSKSNSANLQNSMRYFAIAQKYGNMYNVDPYVLIAMAAQESGGNPNAGNGGILQIAAKSATIKARNASGNMDTFRMTNSSDVDQSFRYAAMRMRGNLDKYNNNYLLSLEEYNKGAATVAYIIKMYPDAVKDGTWLQYREDAREYAARRYGRVSNSRSASQGCIPEGKRKNGKSLWGDTCYIENVLRFYAGNSAELNNAGGGASGEGGEVINTNSSTSQSGNTNTIFGSLKDSISGMVNTLIQSYQDLKLRFEQYLINIINKYEEPYPVAVFEVSVNINKAEDIKKFARAFTDGLLFSEVDLEDENMKKYLFDEGFLEQYDGGLNSGSIDASDSAMQFYMDNIYYGSGGYSPPLGNREHRVTSRFGNRYHPIHKKTKFHAGVDLGAPSGTPVFASKDGVVKTARVVGGYGNVIYLNHGNNEQTRYAHLSKILVTEGQKVTSGQIIGLVGSTGVSSGPHLHFEYRINNKPVDPMAIIQGKRVQKRERPIDSPNSLGGDRRNASSSSAIGNRAVNFVKGQVGKKYGRDRNIQYSEPSTFDCSQLIQWALFKGGYCNSNFSKIPGTTAQWRASGLMKPIPYENLLPGDVILANKGRHVIMYVGNGQIIHASSYSGKVKYDSFKPGTYHYNYADFNNVFRP